MKVLYVLHETSVFNGAYRSAKILLDGLKARGVDMLIITPDRDGAYNTLLADGFNVRCVSGYKHYYWDIHNAKQTIKDFVKRVAETRWIARMIPIVLNYSPDIIYSNSGAIECGYRLARILRKKHVWHLREFLDRDFMLNPAMVEKAAARGDSYFIAVIRTIAEVRGMTDNPHCRIIYNAVEKPKRLETVLLVDRGYLLFVGGMGPTKGLGDLIDAYGRYYKDAGNPIPLKVIGGTPEGVEAFTKRCKDLGIADAVEFLGRRDDVYDFMQHARAVIIPSRFEAYGRVMPEALINRALVVVRNTGGLREHFINCEEIGGYAPGFRFEDIDSLVESLHKVATVGDTEYGRMTDSAFTTATKIYTPESLADNVLAFLNDIHRAQK